MRSSCIVLKRQKISFVYDSSISLPDCVRIWLTLIDQPLPAQILLQSHPLSVDLSAGYIRWQIAAEWLETAQWSQWRVQRKPRSLTGRYLFHCLFSNFNGRKMRVTVCTRTVTLYDLPAQKCGSHFSPIEVQLHDACCRLANMIEDTDMATVPDHRKYTQLSVGPSSE